jgi:hypothetical protein
LGLLPNLGEAMNWLAETLWATVLTSNGSKMKEKDFLTNKFSITMKTLLVILIYALTIFTAKSQNPYKYESKVVTVEATLQVNVGDLFNPRYETRSNLDALGPLITNHNNQGYKLAQMTNVKGANNQETIILVFEKSTSYREAELYKLINELTTRIDTTSKKYTDSAMVLIQTNVLNYLKSIPNDIITQAYKEELTKIILSEAEDKLKKVVEELKKEIRNQSNN